MSHTSRRRSILEEIAAEETIKSQAQDEKDSKQDGFHAERPDVEVGSVETITRGLLGRETRHPLLKTSIEEQSIEEERESAPTVLRPIDTKVARHRLSLSSRNSSSPLSVTTPSDSSSLPLRPHSPRIITLSGSTNGRSRRNTARSGSSSWSPASAFLSQWGRAEAAAAGPLDEGQEIGDTTKYIIGRQIGCGGFSVIKEVFTIEDGEKVRRAVKIVRKQFDGKTEQENETLQDGFEHEASIWRYLKHPYILPLLEVYETSYATFCITQLNVGGTLHDLVRRLRRRNKSASASSTSSSSLLPIEPKRLPIHLKKRYLYQLASALRYLHQDLHIVHRDVKLENCLINQPLTSSEDSFGGHMLLCDFGMADFMSLEDRDSVPTVPSSSLSLTTDVAGSLQYAAPESISSSKPLYTSSIDIWAFGVVCYALLTLRLPFDHEFAPKLTAMIEKAEWDVDILRQAMTTSGSEDNDEDAAEVAEQAILLVRGCFEKEPKIRWNIGRVLECGFFDGCADMYNAEPGT